MELRFEKNDDFTIVKFALPPFAADADELSALIDALARVRALMSPSVASKPPLAPLAWPTTTSWAIFTGHAPGVLSAVLSHPGYGWLRFDLPPKEASDLAGALQKSLSKIPAPQARH